MPMKIVGVKFEPTPRPRDQGRQRTGSVYTGLSCHQPSAAKRVKRACGRPSLID
jgi:hypothetical protein